MTTKSTALPLLVSRIHGQRMALIVPFMSQKKKAKPVTLHGNDYPSKMWRSLAPRGKVWKQVARLMNMPGLR